MQDISRQRIWVLVADGKRALFLANLGSFGNPDLRIIEAEAIENPPAREQGAARAGRTNAGHAGNPRRAAFQETDFHVIAEEDFARKIAAYLNRLAREGKFDRIVVFAPAKSLGLLREHYSPEFEKKIAAEKAKDLTNHTLEEIERQFTSAWAAR